MGEWGREQTPPEAQGVAHQTEIEGWQPKTKTETETETETSTATMVIEA